MTKMAMALALSHPDVFVPNLGVGADIPGEQGDAFLRIEVDHFHAQRTQPIESALEIAAFAHDDRAKAKLPHQAATVPARRERGNHNELPIAALAAGIAEGVCLAVRGRIALLHPPVVS